MERVPWQDPCFNGKSSSLLRVVIAEGMKRVGSGLPTFSLLLLLAFGFGPPNCPLLLLLLLAACPAAAAAAAGIWG